MFSNISLILTQKNAYRKAVYLKDFLPTFSHLSSLEPGRKKTGRHLLNRLKNQCGCVFFPNNLVTLLQIPMPFYSDFGNLCETIPMPPSALEFGGHLCSTPYKITRLTAVLHFFKIPLNPETITIHNTSSSLNS